MTIPKGDQLLIVQSIQAILQHPVDFGQPQLPNSNLFSMFCVGSP